MKDCWRSGLTIVSFSFQQLWRLITCFCFYGGIGFNFFFNLLFTYRYCRHLEEGSFRGRAADFLFMFLFGGTLMIVMALFVNIVFLGSALTIMLVYVWSRRNPFVRFVEGERDRSTRFDSSFSEWIFSVWWIFKLLIYRGYFLHFRFFWEIQWSSIWWGSLLDTFIISWKMFFPVNRVVFVSWRHLDSCE